MIAREKEQPEEQYASAVDVGGIQTRTLDEEADKEEEREYGKRMEEMERMERM